MNSWKTHYTSKLQSAEEALWAVQSGMRVYIQPGCAEPETLVEALMKRAPFVRDVEVVHLLTLGCADWSAPEMEDAGAARYRRHPARASERWPGGLHTHIPERGRESV